MVSAIFLFLKWMWGWLLLLLSCTIFFLPFKFVGRVKRMYVKKFVNFKGYYKFLSVIVVLGASGFPTLAMSSAQVFSFLWLYIHHRWWVAIQGQEFPPVLRFFFCGSLNRKIVGKLKKRAGLWSGFFAYVNFNHKLFEMELSSEIYF